MTTARKLLEQYQSLKAMNTAMYGTAFERALSTVHEYETMRNRVLNEAIYGNKNKRAQTRLPKQDVNHTNLAA